MIIDTLIKQSLSRNFQHFMKHLDFFVFVKTRR
jgi:hypothetical protein